MTRFVLGLLVLLAALASSATQAEVVAPREALRAMTASPFDHVVLRQAVTSLTYAVERDPEDPWAYIGFAHASLVRGYKKGSWFNKRSFDASAIDQAEDLLAKAIDLDDGISRAYAELARIRMIQGKYEEAWTVLNRAHELDRESFYAWHYMSVLHSYYRLYDKAKSLSERAEAQATEDFQLRWVLQQQRRIARAQGDLVAVEESYREEIGLQPRRPHSRGNYANFLRGQGRLEEAKKYYEEALALGEYLLARQQYEQLLEKMKQEEAR